MLYLEKVHKCQPKEAVQMIKEKRPHIWLRQIQLDALTVYYQEQVLKKNSQGSAAG